MAIFHKCALGHVSLCTAILCLRAVHVLRFPACVSGSRPSQAYYQDVTEGGRQQPRCLNETWALANW